MTSPRFDVEDLRVYVFKRWPWVGVQYKNGGVMWNTILPFSSHGWQKINDRGWLSTVQADQCAVHMGTHPAVIWGYSAWINSAVDEPVCAWCGELAPLTNTRTEVKRYYCSREHCRSYRNAGVATRAKLDLAMS